MINTINVTNATAKDNASYVVISTTPFLKRVWLTVPDNLQNYYNIIFQSKREFFLRVLTTKCRLHLLRMAFLFPCQQALPHCLYLKKLLKIKIDLKDKKFYWKIHGRSAMFP
jgi:hypothetical protein